jgi:pimeloyl-ACP methyl ester carboxylesterase/DNA-binding CsgD family transcriptional regulator
MHYYARMEQTIRFCRAPDGVRIAYATSGSGHPLVVSQGWLSHLELDWSNPAMRRFWETLSEHYRVVRYDKRGTGLSDRSVSDFSFDAQLGDLTAVIDAMQAKRVALFGYSQGGPLTIAYAATHAERVSHLALYGTYASGRYGAISELAKALTRLIEVDWGGMGSLSMADIYIPGASTEQRKAFAEYQQKCADKDAAVAQATAVADFRVKDLLPQVVAPTLVLHKRGDKAVPFELGRRLAREISDSRFVPLDGESHLLTVGSTGLTTEALLEFLGTPGSDQAAVPSGLTRRESEILRLLAQGMSSREIGRELTLASRTVERHVSNVYRKIGAHNRAQATAFAIERGLTAKA